VPQIKAIAAAIWLRIASIVTQAGRIFSSGGRFFRPVATPGMVKALAAGTAQAETISA
jgi:hypothetical protein